MQWIKNIINSILGNILSHIIITAVPSIILIYVINNKNIMSFNYIIITIYILYLICILVLNLRYKFRRFSSSREKTMEENTKLLKKIKSTKVFSTRVTHWTIEESSSNRTEFRNELTNIINSGIEVKRLWHIRSKDDITRLEYYLNMYKEKENLSVKCIVGNDILLPEILICYPHAVSISLPQNNSPKKISMCYHFKNKKDVNHWMEYFEVLWTSAIPIFVGGIIYKDNLQKLKNEYKN